MQFLWEVGELLGRRKELYFLREDLPRIGTARSVGGLPGKTPMERLAEPRKAGETRRGGSKKRGRGMSRNLPKLRNFSDR